MEAKKIQVTRIDAKTILVKPIIVPRPIDWWQETENDLRMIRPGYDAYWPPHSKEHLEKKRKELNKENLESERDLLFFLEFYGIGTSRMEKNYFLFNRIFADIYIRDFKLVIDVDGKNHKRTRDYDRRRDKLCRMFGNKVIRFPWTAYWKTWENILRENMGKFPFAQKRIIADRMIFDKRGKPFGGRKPFRFQDGARLLREQGASKKTVYLSTIIGTKEQTEFNS